MIQIYNNSKIITVVVVVLLIEVGVVSAPRKITMQNDRNLVLHDNTSKP